MFNWFKKGNEMDNELENDIVSDAYYLISRFNSEDKEVTQLQVQKLMYLIEALYCTVTGEIKLYDCNFNAWAYGPVAIPLYKKLKKYGSEGIELSQDDLEESSNVCERKRQIIDVIYESFKDKKPMELVQLTHDPEGPWSDVWIKNGKKVVYGEASYIPKKKVAKWFKEKFINNG